MSGLRRPGAPARTRPPAAPPAGLALLTGLALAAGLAVPAGGAAAGAPLEVRLSAATLPQGRTAEVTIRAGLPVSRLEIRFAGRSWPAYPTGPRVWRTILGTDPMTVVGRHVVIADAVARDGRRLTARRGVTVTRVAFQRRHLAFDPEREKILTPAAAAQERRRVNEALRVLHPHQLWRGALVLPVEGPVSSPYGVLSIWRGALLGFHGGVDIAADEGTPVRAAAAGVVRLAEPLPLSGNAVLIDHGLGVVSSYLHLSALSVRPGQMVARGDLIGRVGSTGLATGPHLHWGLRANGVRVDPLPWAWTRR
jgi:murein DD-endopeptidase MepM/ murein hydrolase activator NlpD